VRVSEDQCPLVILPIELLGFGLWLFLLATVGRLHHGPIYQR
jgi:hypothetical protein